MSLKLVFMGTPDFAVPILKTLNDTDHKLLSVYTQPPKKSNRGQKINLSPIHVFSNSIKINVRHPTTLNNQGEIDFFKNLKPDIVIVAAYGKIIPPSILGLKNIKFINVHASLLPKWRGAAPIQRSIIEMDKETGISIMKIISKLDAGPYMLQEKIKIDKKDNYSTLSKKLSILGSKLIQKSLLIIEKKNEVYVDQDESKATYAKKILKQETEISWNLTAKQLIAKINGLYPSPGAWFRHKGNRLKIIEAIEVESSGEPGKVLERELIIACRKNAIKVLFIQKEGKKVLKIKDFLAGHKINIGEKLI